MLTNIGVAKLAKATALGAQVEITQMAVGDGNGALPTPNPAQTALTHEQRRAQLNMLTIDPVNTNQIIAEQVIPEDVGGWWIREVGLFDKDGDMIAVANCAETYKPQLQEGSGRVQVIRVILIVSSTEAVTLKIDPAVVLATRKYVDSAVIEVKAYTDNTMKKHVDAANPHSQYPLIENALKELADAGLVGEVLKNLQLRESFSGVVGQSRNARMSVVAASATATFSADELIVEDSVGRQYRVTSFSKVINLATTGAGGMDTGVVPATGFVALYAIYNPTTSTSALLAVDTTSTTAPEIYGGANMPAGFTASALVSIWRVASGKFIVGEQRGRDISIIDVNAVTTTTTTSSLTAISVASAIPKNAKSVAGWAGTQSTGSSTVQSIRIAGSVQIVGMRLIQVNSATAINAPYTLPILTEQTIYYSNETAGTLVSAAIFINEYSF
nr:phage tail protein [Citrobacter sp. FDAARGOS_156]